MRVKEFVTAYGDSAFQRREEVVRCKDCKNCEMDYTDGVMFGETVCWAWDNGHDYPHFTSPDGFCYQGERRDDA